MGDTTTTTTIMFDAWCPFIRQNPTAAYSSVLSQH